MVQKSLIFAVPSTAAFYIANLLARLWRLAEGSTLDRLSATLGSVPKLFADPLPSLHPIDLLFGLICAGLVLTLVYAKNRKAKKYRPDVEYGSARWGTQKDIKPYMDADSKQNVILTQTEGLMLGSRPRNPKHARNKNVLVIGGSGSGKTRFWLKPSAPVRAVT